MAMKLDQPIGDTSFAAFFIRIPLGAFLIMSGYVKLNPDNWMVIPGYVVEMREMHMLPDTVVTVWAILVPYLEIITGILLVLGFWIIFAAISSVIIFTVVVYHFGIYTNEAKMLLSKDVILLAASISLLYSGGGAFSVDRFRRG